MKALFWLVCLGVVVPAAAAAEADRSEYVWWEAESPVATNFPAETGYSESTFPDKADLLSGGRWLTNDGVRTGEEAFARYSVRVPADGRYRLWARKYWKHGPFRWRFDQDDWRICPRDVPLADSVTIRRTLPVNWVYLGTVELNAGRHDFELRLLAEVGQRKNGCFDVFFLSRNDLLVPSGNRPPDAPPAPGPAEWFPVAFYDDDFSPDSVTDMSRLVEAPAGGHGFLTEEGDHLRFSGSPEPVVFWGCGANLLDIGRDQMTQRARYLRKYGVNMVREHPLEGELGTLRDDGTFAPQKLDDWDYWFSELKKQGIYVTVSFFYAHHIKQSEGYDLYDELRAANQTGAGAVEGEKTTSGLVNIEPALQQSEWRYVKAFLTHANPYTGLRYVDDPALAVVEAHNEDCIFWGWPLNALAEGKEFPKHTARLKARWAAWLKQRYGDDEKLRAAWGAGMRAAATPWTTRTWASTARATCAPTVRGTRPRSPRLGDYVRFLAELQRSYYEQRVRDLRSIGYKAVVITTAWRAGGAAADAANLWCDTAGGMIDRHNYFGGGAGHYYIAPGRVNNRSELAAPGSGMLGSGLYQVEDRAFSMTEWTSSPPNQWKLEAAPLMAFYAMGLQGWDASYHFLNSGCRMLNGWPNLSSYVTDTPHYAGQFPALAFALYNGHIRQAPVVAARRLTQDDLFRGVDPLQQDFTGGGYDAKELQGTLATPKELLAVGRVTISFDGGRSQASKVDRVPGTRTRASSARPPASSHGTTAASSSC